MEIRFDGQSALVTGAGKGIGRAIAIQLANLGAKVHVISRTQADLDSLQQQVPSIDTYNVDVADWEKTRAAVENIGPIDLLVNNAGITNCSAFLDVTKEELDNVFDINFKAVFNISQLIAKGMVARGKGGAIVNISSVAGMRACPERSIYCSSKSALDMLTKTMALELGPHQVRVNSVNPGLVMTPMAMRTEAATPEFQEYAKQRIPLRRIPEVDDVVKATLFLLSKQASMIHGTVIPVDGGVSGTI